MELSDNRGLIDEDTVDENSDGNLNNLSEKQLLVNAIEFSTLLHIMQKSRKF